MQHNLTVLKRVGLNLSEHKGTEVQPKIPQQSRQGSRDLAIRDQACTESGVGSAYWEDQQRHETVPTMVNYRRFFCSQAPPFNTVAFRLCEQHHSLTVSLQKNLGPSIIVFIYLEETDVSLSSAWGSWLAQCSSTGCRLRQTRILILTSFTQWIRSFNHPVSKTKASKSCLQRAWGRLNIV